MVKKKSPMCASQLLQEKRWCAHFARRIVWGRRRCGSACVGRAFGQAWQSGQMDRLGSIISYVSWIWHFALAANIHHPSSSSVRTIRCFSVSTESTAPPVEKLLSLASEGASWKARFVSTTGRTLLSPVPIRSVAASRSLPLQLSLDCHVHLSLFPNVVLLRSWNNSTQFARAVSHLCSPGEDYKSQDSRAGQLQRCQSLH